MALVNLKFSTDVRGASCSQLVETESSLSQRLQDLAKSWLFFSAHSNKRYEHKKYTTNRRIHGDISTDFQNS